LGQNWTTGLGFYILQTIQLAIGNVRGNVFIYNKKTQRKVAVASKASRAITCGAWNSKNLLAVGSEDRQLMVLNSEGEIAESTNLKAPPLDMMVKMFHMY
jgi:WD repeat-containing protein 19